MPIVTSLKVIGTRVAARAIVYHNPDLTTQEERLFLFEVTRDAVLREHPHALRNIRIGTRFARFIPINQTFLLSAESFE